MWEKKAVDIGVAVKSLMTWYDSVRTRVGKLTAQTSGSCARVNTDRDEFILRNFGFLKAHIVRLPSRLAVSVSVDFCIFMIIY